MKPYAFKIETWKIKKVDDLAEMDSLIRIVLIIRIELGGK